MKKKLDLTTWTVDQLTKRAISLHCSINQSECFGSHDISDYLAVEAELNHRGYEFQETKTLSIVKGYEYGLRKLSTRR